jgi:hypothetical protein
MADDGWLGNQACDPANGKAKASSPEQLRGRADLFAIMHQDVLRQARAGGAGAAAKPSEPAPALPAACRVLPAVRRARAARHPAPPRFQLKPRLLTASRPAASCCCCCSGGGWGQLAGAKGQARGRAKAARPQAPRTRWPTRGWAT